MKKSILILFFAIFAFATVSVSANETTDDTKTKITSVDDTKVKTVELTDKKTSEKEANIEANLDTEALYCHIVFKDGSEKKCWLCKCTAQ